MIAGVGRQCGPRRADWGARWADLECPRCGATWVGQIGETCSYCALIAERSTRTPPPRIEYVPGVLECPTCGQLFDDGPMLERAVCGVHGGPTTCNGRLRRVRA